MSFNLAQLDRGLRVSIAFAVLMLTPAVAQKTEPSVVPKAQPAPPRHPSPPQHSAAPSYISQRNNPPSAHRGALSQPQNNRPTSRNNRASRPDAEPRANNRPATGGTVYTFKPNPPKTYTSGASNVTPRFSAPGSKSGAVTYTPRAGESGLSPDAATNANNAVKHADGVTTYTPRAAPAHAAKSSTTFAPNATLKSNSNGTQTVRFRNGSVAAIRGPGVEIHRSLMGGRTVITTRSGATLVSTGPHRGYLERPIMVGNRTLIQRTYFAGDRTFTRAYLRYSVGGLALPYYVPGFYYPAAFYGWAYYAWASPVAYAWAWTGDPWFAFYGGYFTPYGVYPSGYAWLTDYVISQTLAEAYTARMQQDAESATYGDTAADAPADDDTLYAHQDTPITPEIKDAIAAEVQHDIAYESAEVSGQAQPDIGEFPASLKPGRAFVVSSAIDVSTPDDHVCSLTPGDVLRFDAAEGSGTAELRVASSHRQDCPAGIEVTLSLADLQEMVNTLRAQLDEGLTELHADQGQNGLPAAPQSSMGAVHPSGFAATPDNADIGPMIDQQRQEASTTEKQAAQSALPAKH